MTTIEWCRNADGTQGVTWNPIRARHRETGKRGWFCVHKSDGCRFCYSEWQNMKGGDSGGNGLAYAAQNLAKIEVYLDEKTLLAPLSWRKPRTIFVCSMSDLFGEFVPDAWIDRIFAVMALSPQHTFQVLTKRSERLREYFAKAAPNVLPYEGIRQAVDSIIDRVTMGFNINYTKPLPNVWLGVSAERQKEADERIPDLLATPAAIRFVSCEPLLGPIDLTNIRVQLEGKSFMTRSALSARDPLDKGSPELTLDWVIAGGESGKDARPMHPAWARSLRDQCAAAGVPFFFKQWGEWADQTDSPPAARRASQDHIFSPNGEVLGVGVEHGRHGMVDCDWRDKGGAWMGRVGHKKAGRLLDGRLHDAMPARAGEARRGEAA
ncbi:MAG: phage Gp37/Gp68 family protein [Pseudorhodoplanes sp.]|nr:phage Gp37/Gp68 family protein [Pseudorhodoplanes sp.]